jgi:hypothetical protein
MSNSKIQKRFFGGILVFSFSSIFLLKWVFLSGAGMRLSQFQDSELNQIRTIEEYFSDSQYFWEISDFCCDEENNLYVADSGWAKIFKFSCTGKYIMSFGREGQGPGEFLGKPYGLYISIGNNRLVYVTDPSAERLSIFNQDGILIKQWSMPTYLFDRAIADSQGNIYLLDRRSDEIINVCDKNFKIINHFLDRRKVYRYPIVPPQKRQIYGTSEGDLAKMLTKKDRLVAFSNHSLRAYYFGRDQKIITEFDIKNKAFLKDFSMRLKKAKEKGGFIKPFHACLDEKDNLALVYFNSSLNNWELYRYRLDGRFIDSFSFPDDYKEGKVCFDGKGNIYRAVDSVRVIIYMK